MNLDLTGKYALVGGGSKGLGLASATELAGMGATVTLVSRTESDLMKAVKTLPTPQGQQHDVMALDYDQPEEVRQAVRKKLETQAYHILVNNTGGPPGGPIRLAKVEEFEVAFRRHLLVNQILSQLLMPGMRADGYGRIINVISTSVKQPLNGLGVSNTVRAAVANWAKTLATEVAPFGITVNNVLPGATRTERLADIIRNKSGKSGLSEEDTISAMEAEIPMGRFARPEEFGAAVAFLASPAAAYITGINLPVDGGRTGCL